jgi:predicted enzyme related to lactoylglutathione lyase
MTSTHGRFVWYELMATDPEAAKTFYTAVIGWGTRDASRPGLPYTLFTAGETPVCGVLTLPKDACRGGSRPGWIGYVGVDDVDVTAARLQKLGGVIDIPPQDVLELSRFAVVADPQMAAIALFKWLDGGGEQPADHHGLGHIGWHELLAVDWEQVWSFYSDLFGWQKAEADRLPTGMYQTFSAGGKTIGGMQTKPATLPDPFWLYYFNVGDIEAAAGRVKAAGGRILKGPVELLGGNCIVHGMDPQGTVFALLGDKGVGYYLRPRTATGTGAPRPR